MNIAMSIIDQNLCPICHKHLWACKCEKTEPMIPTIEDVLKKYDPTYSGMKAAMQWEQIQNKVKDERIKELEAWKQMLFSVWPDMQAIGKEINVPLGESVHDKILPFIKRLKLERDKFEGGDELKSKKIVELESGIEELKKDRDWFMRAHNQLLQDNVELQNKSTKLREGLEELNKEMKMYDDLDDPSVGDFLTFTKRIRQLLSELKNNVP
jgi:predicted RNase H-like nuclease (RuvC/YqgF family)